MSKKVGPVAWTALRQAQALRDSLVWGIAGLALPANEDNLGMWLGCQGLNDGEPVTTNKKSEPSIRIYNEVRHAFMAANGGNDLTELAKDFDCPDPKLEGFGEHRSGGGWEKATNFIITSAFVRLLGSEEQFEVDVLKALFHYRPQGVLGSDAELVHVDADVILERPKKDATGRISFSQPHLWTWLRKQADNRGKRNEIFKNVFGITVIPSGYTQETKNEWYEKRNKIAHGIDGVSITLGEYVNVEVFVAKTIMSIQQQCLDRLKIAI